jgi:hypothetical protein
MMHRIKINNKSWMNFQLTSIICNHICLKKYETEQGPSDSFIRFIYLKSLNMPDKTQNTSPCKLIVLNTHLFKILFQYVAQINISWKLWNNNLNSHNQWYLKEMLVKMLWNHHRVWLITHGLHYSDKNH